MSVAISLVWRHETVAKLEEAAGRFGQWWLREFLALFPPPTARWLMGPGKTALLFAARGSDIELSLQADGSTLIAKTLVHGAQRVASAIAGLLRENGLTADEVGIGVVLPLEQFFERKLTLPPQVARALDEVVAQDLAQRTPFKLADIHFDYVVAPEAGKLVVTQVVVRRESVRAAAAAFGLRPDQLNFVACAAQDRGSPDHPVIALHRNRRDRSSVRRIALALVASALLLASITGGLTYWRQSAVLGTLAPQIAKARQQAQAVRTAFAKLERRHTSIGRVFVQKHEAPSLLATWEEATRLLPSDSWLTELRFTENQQEHRIVMTGFSTAAAKLVGIFDQSPLFHDASLTTAIAVDPVQERERFSLQAQLRSSAARSTKP